MKKVYLFLLITINLLANGYEEAKELIKSKSY